MLGFTASSMKNVRYWRYLNSRRKLAFSAQRLSQKIIPSSTPQTDEFLGWRPTQMNYGGSASFHLRIYNSPGRSRCPFSRDEARENGFTGERRGGTFNRSIAQKSAASPQHVQRRKERTVMKVLIAGASGALGTPLTRALIAAGHEVLGLARSPESIDRLTHLGAHPILANVMDRDDLLRAVKGVQADAVIHALTALKKTPLRHQDMYATNALHDVGTTNL